MDVNEWKMKWGVKKKQQHNAQAQILLVYLYMHNDRNLPTYITYRMFILLITKCMVCDHFCLEKKDIKSSYETHGI